MCVSVYGVSHSLVVCRTHKMNMNLFLHCAWLEDTICVIKAGSSTTKKDSSKTQTPLCAILVSSVGHTHTESMYNESEHNALMTKVRYNFKYQERPEHRELPACASPLLSDDETEEGLEHSLHAQRVC